MWRGFECAACLSTLCIQVTYDYMRKAWGTWQVLTLTYLQAASKEIERKLMSSACQQCPKLYMRLSVGGQALEQVCLRLYRDPRNVAQLRLTGARLPMSRAGLGTGSSIAGIVFTDHTMKVKRWLASPVPLVRWHLVLIKREQLLDEAGS